MSTGNYVPLESLGYAQLTAATSAAAVGLTASYPTVAQSGRPGIPNFAYISVDGASARWRDDGVAPTTSVGMPMLTTSPPMAYDGELGEFQIIGAVASGAATVNVSFYRAY